MIARRRKPRPYIDTNIILDYIRNRNHESVLLMETIKHKRIKCWASYYAVLELLDRAQESRWVWKRAQSGETLDDIFRQRFPRKLSVVELCDDYEEVNEKFLKPFVDTDIIAIMVPFDNSWDSILAFLRKDNFSIGDAFQIDAAIGSHCNVFITWDSGLIKMINGANLILATTPRELDKSLAENGIRRIV
jgi:predicted nucleic acid-binding protein